MTQATRPDIERYVIVGHPKYDQVTEAVVTDLRHSRLRNTPILRLNTVAGGHEPNAKQLQNVLQPGDAIGVVGGEGTYRTIVTPFLMGMLGIRVPITSLGGGTARDISRSVHWSRGHRPSRQLERSVVVPAYALEATITAPDGTTTTDYAISYAGLGRTAAAAEIIDRQMNKGGGLSFGEVLMGLRCMADSISFDMYEPKTDSKHTYGELTFGKARRMARIGRLPVDAWDKEYVRIPVGASTTNAAIAAGRLIVGHPHAVRSSEPYGFRLLTDSSIHFDGEKPLPLAAGTNITIGLAEQSYPLLTTLHHG